MIVISLQQRKIIGFQKTIKLSKSETRTLSKNKHLFPILICVVKSFIISSKDFLVKKSFFLFLLKLSELNSRSL
jgi:hypothetical protein